jgi:hypothetical protein
MNEIITEDQKDKALFLLISSKDPGDADLCGIIARKTGMKVSIVRRYRRQLSGSIAYVQRLKIQQEAELAALRAEIQTLKAGIFLDLYPHPPMMPQTPCPRIQLLDMEIEFHAQIDSLQNMQALGLIEIIGD